MSFLIYLDSRNSMQSYSRSPCPASALLREPFHLTTWMPAIRLTLRKRPLWTLKATLIQSQWRPPSEHGKPTAEVK